MKMQKVKREILLCILILSVFVFGGCKSLEQLMDETTDTNGNHTSYSSDMHSVEDMLEPFVQDALRFYETFDPVAMPCAMVSFVTGCVMLILNLKSKNISKIAIFSFMIFIPLVLNAIQLGMGIWLSGAVYG